MKILKSLENLLNKDKVTYEEYELVHNEITSKMFPDLHFKLNKEKIKDGAKNESDMIDLLEQIHILRENFPDFDKKEQEEFLEIDKMLKEYNDKQSKRK